MLTVKRGKFEIFIFVTFTRIVLVSESAVFSGVFGSNKINFSFF